MKIDKIEEQLNLILEHELAGVVRYTHYSLMAFGNNRIPIVAWLRNQAVESLDHANQAGENITSRGGHPSLKISNLLDTHKHDITAILEECLGHEKSQLDNFKKLFKLVENESIFLEEYSRKMIYEEEIHVSEIEKMLRKPE